AETHQMIIPIHVDTPNSGKVLVFNYQTGQEEYTFKCNYSVWDLNILGDILFVRANGIFAWNLRTGDSVTLPSNWLNTDDSCFGEELIAHTDYRDLNKTLEVHKGISIKIYDTKTFKLQNVLETDYFRIFDMAIRNGEFWLFGCNDNCTFDD